VLRSASRCPDSRTFFERLFQRWVQIKIKGTSYVRKKVMPNAASLLMKRWAT